MKKLLLSVVLLIFSSLGAMEKFYLGLWLLNKSDENPTEEDYKKEIDVRISKGFSGKQFIKPYDRDHLSLLVRFVYCNYPKLIKRLFKHDSTLINNRKKVTKAMVACVFRGNFELLRYFIDKGGEVNHKADCDFTLLQRACLLGSNSIIKLLLISSANPNMQDMFGAMALHQSLIPSFEIEERVRSLIVGGSDHMIKQYNNCGPGSKYNEKTAVEIAKIENKPELALLIEQVVDQREKLLQAVANGVDINFINIDGISRRHVRDIQGNSLLYYALKYQNYTVVNKLLYLWPQLLNQPNFEGELVFDSLVNCK